MARAFFYFEEDFLALSWWDGEIVIGGETTTARDWLRENWQIYTDMNAADILSEICERSVTISQVRHVRQAMGFAKNKWGEPLIVRNSEASTFDNAPVVVADSVLVLADIHAPYHNGEWCSHLVAEAKRVGIEHVLLAGDLLDFASLSSFTKKMVRQNDADIDTAGEIDSAVDVCDALLNSFESITCTLGNHEERLTRRLAVRTRVTVLRHLLGYRHEKRFDIQPYFYAIIETSNGQTWRVTHPKNFSVIPCKVARGIADKEQQNVISAHQHSWGEATSVSGFYVADCGCCADPEKLEYVALRDNTKPKMQTGAWALLDCQPVLLHQEFRPHIGGK